MEARAMHSPPPPSASACESGTEANFVQNAVLHPPSYFKTAVNGAEANADGCQRSAASTASTYVIRHESPLHNDEGEQITALRLQNEALRSQLRVLHNAPSTAAFPLSHSHYTPAMFTSDLRQVECALQSRLAHSETEAGRLAAQLAVVENTLREERARHSGDTEALVSQHHVAVEQARSERCEVGERWRRECEEWRERVGRMEEKMGELKRAEEKAAHVMQENSGLVSELEQERSHHREEVASLQLQLSTAEEQTGHVQSECEAMRRRVERLESYLGGELPEEGSGVTWREERAALRDKITMCEEDRGKTERETQLMATRLVAISEILSLQEARLTQQKEGDIEVPGQGGGGGGGRGGREDGGGFKSVLSLWREKVFALLVQARLQEMQHRTDIHQARCKVSGLEAAVSEVTRERDLTRHTLLDRTAQLQLQINHTKGLESRLEGAEKARSASQMAVDNLTSRLHLTVSSVRETAETCARFKSCVDGCLSRLANYEQRVGVATRRVAAFRAMLSSLVVLQGVDGGGCSQRCEVTTQTELPDKSLGVSKLSHGELVEEVATLLRERDALTDQLSQITASLQQLRNTSTLRQQALEEMCSSLRADNSTLSEQLAEVRTELSEHRQREAEVDAAQASLQARIDSAVMEERRRGRHELSEAQSLLEVARREQAKTALQLQLAEKKLQRDCASAVEAVEVSKRGVEEDLVRCRERLRAVQVERNILLTTLRQEGVQIPPKRPLPKQMPVLTTQPDPPMTHCVDNAPADAHITVPPHKTVSENNCHSQEDCATRAVNSTPAATTVTPQCETTSANTHHSADRELSSSPPSTDGASGEGCSGGGRREGGGACGDSEVVQQQETTLIRRIATGTPLITPTLNNTHDTEKNKEDIHNVLKELQLLSTSLLDMRAVTS